MCGWLNISVLMKEVRTQERALSLFEQQPGFPTVRHVRRMEKLEAILSGVQQLAVFHPQCRPDRHEVIDAHELADHTAYSHSLRCKLLPLTQGTAFIRFKMAEPDPLHGCRINQRGHSVSCIHEECKRACMKEQRLVVTYEKLIELQIEVRHEGGNPEQIRRDFGHSGHEHLRGWQKRDRKLPPTFP